MKNPTVISAQPAPRAGRRKVRGNLTRATMPTKPYDTPNPRVIVVRSNRQLCLGSGNELNGCRGCCRRVISVSLVRCRHAA